MSYKFSYLTPTSFFSPKSSTGRGNAEFLMEESLSDKPEDLLDTHFSAEDRLITGTMSLPSWPNIWSDDISCFEQNDPLLSLMFEPHKTLAGELNVTEKEVTDIIGEDVTLFFNYNKEKSENKSDVTFLSNSNLCIINAPRPSTSYFSDEEFLHFLENPTPQKVADYWNQIIENKLIPDFFKNIVFKRFLKMPLMDVITNRDDLLGHASAALDVTDVNNTVHISDSDNSLAYGHFYLDNKRPFLQKMHYAMLRNPSLMELIINSPQYGRRLIINKGDSSMEANDVENEEYKGIVFKVNRDKDFRAIYQTRNSPTSDEESCQCTQPVGVKVGNIINVDVIYHPLWIQCPPPGG